MNTGFVTAPVIDLGRVILRPDALTDFERFVEIWADPGVIRFIGGRPFTRSESWSRFLRNAGLWPMLGYGYWAVIDKESGAYWGNAGFADFERGIDAIAAIPEAGWALAPEAQGRGLASLIVGALVGWADAHLPHAETCCIIDPDNVASIRVAEKNGFRPGMVADYAGSQVRVFSRPRTQAAALVG